MNSSMANNVCVSFVHGFHDAATPPTGVPVPALWEVHGEREQVHRYIFPVNPADFEHLPYPLVGQGPRTATGVERWPRYGFTGLGGLGAWLYAAGWNGIYKLDARTKQVVAFITNPYTCYMHRFHVDEDQIIIAVPFKDMVVVMDHTGQVRDTFWIDLSLRIRRDGLARDLDWRFISKPWSGTCGYYHFNNVQVCDGRILLTSRNLGAFLVVDPRADRCSLRTLNYHTPTCIHDGDWVDGHYYFTSIDGKIIVASDPPEHDAQLFNYDLHAEHHRLADVELNWCRGIAVGREHVYVTIDGRYGDDPNFKLLELDREFRPTAMRKFAWSQVGDESRIRFVTGFDLVIAE